MPKGNKPSPAVGGRGDPTPAQEDAYTTRDAARDMVMSGDVLSAADLVVGPTETPRPVRVGRPRGRRWPGKVTIMLDAELMAALNDHAQRNQTSASAAGRALIDAGLRSQETRST